MSKELDEETGLYYYGARYLDPKYSRWLSGDPALNDYIPVAPTNDQAKKHNENLPGMGGVFNTVNLHVYHYAGNNPVKYIDPDGRQQAIAITPSDLQMFVESVKQTFSSVPTPLVVVEAVATGVIIADDYFDGAISEGIANGINFVIDKATETGKSIANKGKEFGSWIGDGIKNAWDNIFNIKAKDRRREQQNKSKEEKHLDRDWEEPASEEYGKWKAREAEKQGGKEARRNLHDKKEKGAPDRTKEGIK